MSTHVNRRNFLEVGALSTLGVGTDFLKKPIHATQTASSSNDTNGSVQMFGDGLGLSPDELAKLWTDLASDNRIEQDSYSNGGAVEQLETTAAGILGKERAIFMPTGTLANHLAVRALAAGKGTVAVQAESHLFNDSGDCVQRLSNLPLIPLGDNNASFTLEELEHAADRTQNGRVQGDISVISIETPVRRKFGETFEPEHLNQVIDFAHRNKIRLHLDGARIFLQAAYEKRSVAEYAAPFDTVYVSLYKYFNAPSGAILAGPHSLLDNMFHTRRMFGSGLPAAWPFAAIANHYMPGFIQRYQEAISASKQWLVEISRHEAFAAAQIPNGTNLMRLHVAGNVHRFRQNLQNRGIQIGPPRANNQFLIAINETWNRQTPTDLVRAFVSSLA